MKEAIVHPGPRVEIIDSPIPEPGPGQVVIKTIVSGSNPKDWKVPEWMEDQPSMNQGDDIAGTIHAVGSNVTEFRKGDRVAAFHEMTKPGGSYAEYSLAWAHTTFFIPEKTSFEEAAAIPLAAMTAAVGLFAGDRLGLPPSWAPATEPTPLLVYGAASAVGVYVLQLAKKSNIHPLICIAGRAQEYVEGFIDRSKGDTIIDYRKGDEAIVKGVQEALGGKKLYHAYDAVAEKGSPQNIGKLLASPGGRSTFVLPPPGKGWDGKFEGLADEVHQSMTMVGSVHDNQKELGYVYFRYFTRGLEEGWFKGQRTEVVPKGLEGVQGALENLKEGKASAVKYIFRIADTPGIDGGKENVV
ncbi:putative secondary metabolism biosynthetic enzyme [Recurvomyces mirabilis]|uniref:Secondary metabolism biosynthetic enzyme n=2 Tax=Recurvomyces mirabilis TaxID=574656 RepID=A0AAE0WLX7_9PEZI|nr:putative secondary metabolism biosynthetic enzyme [Recurvomyces mirabilis]